MEKVLMFCSNPVNGGTAKVFTELTRGLLKVQEKAEIEILPCVNAGNPVTLYRKKIPSLMYLDIISPEVVHGDIHAIRNPVMRLIKKTKRVWKYRKFKKENVHYLRGFLRENQIDCVIVHNGGYVGDDLCNQLLYAADKEQIKARIMVFHSDFNKSLWSKARYYGYDRRISSITTHIVTVSEFTKHRIMSQSFIRRKIDVIYNGMERISILSESEKRAILNMERDTDFIIGMIGNFYRIKGQIYLLKAIEQLRKLTAAHIKVAMIGNIYDQEYYHQCLAYIDEKDLKELVSIYTGIESAGEFASCFDVLAVPTIEDESFGLISVEAMMEGVPIVAFACGGLPEVIGDKKDGFVVPNKDFASMAKALRQLLEDKRLREAMGDNARNTYLERFTCAHMASCYESYIKSAVHQGKF